MIWRFLYYLDFDKIANLFYDNWVVAILIVGFLLLISPVIIACSFIAFLITTPIVLITYIFNKIIFFIKSHQREENKHYVAKH